MPAAGLPDDSLRTVADHQRRPGKPLDFPRGFLSDHQRRLLEQQKIDPCGVGALGSPRSVLDVQEQRLEATLADRGVRGAFLCCGGKELPLAFADIRREEANVSVMLNDS